MLLGPLADALFPAIDSEIAARGTDDADRDAFLLLGHVGGALREMLPPDAGADALEQASELLWHAWRFARTGSRLYVMSDAATARLMAPESPRDPWRFAAPPACYVQLPYQRAWARVSEQAAYEPFDGWFAAARTLPSGTHEIRVLAVLGLRDDRPGISLLAHHATLDERDIGEHLAHPWRESGEPYANVIPGGERMGYRTLATRSELEALALRAWRVLDEGVAALERHDGAPEGPTEANVSRLAHVHIS